MDGESIGAMLLHVLPLAAGAAVSPALLAASLEILLAFGKRGRGMLLLYLLGAAIVVAVVIAVSALLPSRPVTQAPSVLSDIVDVVLGALLLALAVVLLVRRPKPKPAGAAPRGGVQRLLASKWAGLGVLGLGLLMMVTNVSTLVMVLAGAHAVNSGPHDVLGRVIGDVLLGLGAVLPILLPLVWVLISPTAATRSLGRFGALLGRHSRVIGVVVSAIVGAYLLLRGFGLI